VSIGGARTTDEGEWLGRYEILRRLENAPTHEVLLARAHGPSGFTRIVELKRHFGAHDRLEARELAREARAYALLSSPWILRLHDFLLLDGDPVLVLEHLPGVSLEHAVRSLTASGRQLPEDAALYVGHAIAAALASAHAARPLESSEPTTVVHRNLCPANVHLAWTGDAKLGGFAMAKVLDGGSEPTRPGVVHGAYGYMAPEQVLAGEYSTASDVYSAALVLYELLSRRRAVDVDELPELELIRAMAEPSFPPLASLRPYLHPSLCAAISTALSPRPEHRTITAAQLAAVLASMVDLATARETLVGVLGTVREEEGNGAKTPRTPHVDVPEALPSDPDATERFRLDDIQLHCASLAPDSLRAAAAMALTDPPPRKTGLAFRIPALQARWLFAAVLGLAIFATVVGIGRSVTNHGSSSSGAASSGTSSSVARPRATPDKPIAVTPAAPPAATAMPPPSATAPPSAPPPAPSAAKAGLLLLPPRSAGHRIFVDGRVVGEGPRPYQVPCGARRVRVGSAGVERVVAVPCGGSVQVL
jgi:eukaryotic-like serine/threonine-protein kinase